MKTKTAKQFLALGIAMIVSGLGSSSMFEFALKRDFPQQFWLINGLLILIGAVLFYSGIRNIWVNAMEKR